MDDVADSLCHSLDAAFGQQQPVKLDVTDFPFCSFHISGIFRQDLFRLLLDGIRHGEKGAVFLLTAELGQAWFCLDGISDNIAGLHGFSVPSNIVLILKT